MKVAQFKCFLFQCRQMRPIIEAFFFPAFFPPNIFFNTGFFYICYWRCDQYSFLHGLSNLWDPQTVGLSVCLWEPVLHNYRDHSTGHRTQRLPITALLLTRVMTLNKSFSFSTSQFSHLSNTGIIHNLWVQFTGQSFFNSKCNLESRFPDTFRHLVYSKSLDFLDFKYG